MLKELDNIMAEYKTAISDTIRRAKYRTFGGCYYNIDLPRHGEAPLAQIQIAANRNGLRAVRIVAPFSECAGWSTISRNFAGESEDEFRTALKNILTAAPCYEVGSLELSNLIKNI